MPFEALANNGPYVHPCAAAIDNKPPNNNTKIDPNRIYFVFIDIHTQIP